MGTALGQALGIDLGIDLGTDLCPRSTFAGTPDTILAAGDKKGWWRADQGITLNGSRVSGWSNIWSNGNMAQATAGAQPLYSATGMNGRAVLIADDTARFMTATLTSTIAVGNRAYLWCYCRLTALPTAFKYLGVLCSFGSNPRVAACTYSTDNWRILNNDNNGHSVSADSGVPLDFNRHLVEAGFTTGGVDQWVLSGAGLTNTTMSTIASQALNNVFVFSLSGSAGGPVGGMVSEIICMIGEPTTQQKLDMRRYFQTYYGTI